MPKNTSWRQNVRHDFKNTSWLQKHVMTSNVGHDIKNMSWRQKYAMTSKRSSCHDSKMFVVTSKNTLCCKKVCHDIKNTSWHENVRHDVKKFVMTWTNILIQILHSYDVSLPSYQRLCVFHTFVDLDLWPIPVIFCNNSGIIPGYPHVTMCNHHPTYNEVMVWYKCSKWGFCVSISEGIIDDAFNVMLLVQCYGRTWCLTCSVVGWCVTSEMRTGIGPADWCAAVRSLPAARKPVRLDWQLALSSQQEQTCLWIWELTMDYVKC